MRVHWLQHARHETLGSIEPWLKKHRHEVSCTRLYAEDPLPPPESVDWLLILGGPMNIYQYRKYPWLKPEKRFIEQVLVGNRKVLGICLGAQLLADVLGGKTRQNKQTEIGFFKVYSDLNAADSDLLSCVPSGSEVFHWHGDTYDLPPGAIGHHKSDACVNQSFTWGARVLGLQFHLEVGSKEAAHWLELANPAPSAYVQTAGEILARPERFAGDHRMMNRVLDVFAKA